MTEGGAIGPGSDAVRASPAFGTIPPGVPVFPVG